NRGATSQGQARIAPRLYRVVPQGDIGVARFWLVPETLPHDFQRIDFGEVTPQSIAVRVGKVRRLVRIQDALLVALKLLETESILLQNLVRLLHRPLDDRLDVLQLDAAFRTALLRH